MEKKTRTPRNFETILKGALALTLKEKADLRNALAADIKEHVSRLDQQAKEAKELAG